MQQSDSDSVFKKNRMEAPKEDIIENYFRANRDKFDVGEISDAHSEKFLFKLNKRLKHLVNIVSYLLRVAIATVVIFIASIVIWNNFIRHDRHEISLKEKITHIFSRIPAGKQS